jgi:hypothetical protein
MLHSRICIVHDGAVFDPAVNPRSQEVPFEEVISRTSRRMALDYPTCRDRGLFAQVTYSKIRDSQPELLTEYVIRSGDDVTRERSMLPAVPAVWTAAEPRERRPITDSSPARQR